MALTTAAPLAARSPEAAPHTTASLQECAPGAAAPSLPTRSALDDVLAEAENLDTAMLRGLGSTLVIAPHADDESLGCGGIVALLRRLALPVTIVLVSDGTQSHPNSRRFDAEARRVLREAELAAAAACLGVAAADLVFLRLPDGAVPGPGSAGFDDAVARIRALVGAHAARTVLAPWRRDPHPDHRASHAVASAALGATREQPVRLFEYLVWAPQRASPDELPQPGEARVWRLDIAAVVDAKRRAIAAHRSQLGLVIADDPGGFAIAPAMHARAEQPAEYFLEALP